jgi:hypothetical protein
VNDKRVKESNAYSRCVKELFERRELAMALIPSGRRLLPVKLVNVSSAETEVDQKKRRKGTRPKISQSNVTKKKFSDGLGSFRADTIINQPE